MSCGAGEPGGKFSESLQTQEMLSSVLCVCQTSVLGDVGKVSFTVSAERAPWCVASPASAPNPPRRAHARAPPRGRSADTRRPRGVCRQPLPLCRRLLSCSLRPGCSCPSPQLPVCGVRAGSGSLAPPGLVRGQRTWTCAALATRRRCGPTETAEAGARGGVWG